MSRRAPIVLCSLALLAACAGAPLTPDDAPRDDAPAARSPTPPAAPAPPELTPCPAGWREAGRLGARVCEPFAEEAAPVCASDELVLPGQPAGAACQPAWPCPAGAWPDGAPPDAVHVAAGASGGDGSRERPLGTLAEALAIAAGRTIVLGEGTFAHSAGVAPLRSTTTIVGLCPARSRLVDTATDRSAPIVAIGHVTLRGVSLEGADLGLWVTSTGQATLEGVVVRGQADAAIRVDGGGRVEGARVRADRPLVRLDDEAATVLVGPTSVVTLRASTVSGGGSAFFGYRRSSDPSDVFAALTVEDSSVLETPLAVSGRFEAELSRLAIERVGLGIVVIPPRTARLTDVRVRDVGLAHLTPIEPPVFSSGLGDVIMTRVTASAIRGGFVYAASADGFVPGHTILRDVVIDGVAGRVAIAVDPRAALEAERLAVGDVGGTALQSEGGPVSVLDARITGVRLVEHDGAPFGDAFAGRGGAHLRIERAYAEVERGAVLVTSASATVLDLDVLGGQGIQAQCEIEPCAAPGSITAERLRFRDMVRFALSAIGSSIAASDVDVDGVSWLGTEIPGVGVLAFQGEVRGSRYRVRGAEGVGVMSLRDGIIALTALEVADARTLDCPACGTARFAGDGITAAVGGRLELSEFEVHGSARAGLVLAEGSPEPVLAHGRIHDNAIGMLTDARRDPGAFAGTRVEDNGVNFYQENLSFEPSDLGL